MPQHLVVVSVPAGTVLVVVSVPAVPDIDPVLDVAAVIPCPAVPLIAAVVVPTIVLWTRLPPLAVMVLNQPSWRQLLWSLTSRQSHCSPQ